MAKGWIVIKCPGCETPSRRILKMPSENGKTLEHYTCPGCESGIKALIQRKLIVHEATKFAPEWSRRSEKELSIETSVVRPSKLLLDMLEEEKREKEASDGYEKEKQEVQTENQQVSEG